MEFPETEEGASLLEELAHLGIKDPVGPRRWCEWQIRKWGVRGARESLRLLLRFASRGRDPAAYARWCMGAGNELKWMPDDDYRRFKLRYGEEYRRYVGWKLDQNPEGYGSIRALLDAELRRLRLKRSSRPPSVEW